MLKVKDDLERQYRNHFLTVGDAWRKMEQQRQAEITKMLDAINTPISVSMALTLKSLEFPIVSELEKSIARFKSIDSYNQSIIGNAIKSLKNPVGFAFDDALKKLYKPIEFNTVFKEIIDQHQSQVKASLDSFVKPVAFDTTAQIFKKLADEKAVFDKLFSSLNLDDLSIDRQELESDLEETYKTLSEAKDDASFFEAFNKLKPHLRFIFYWLLALAWQLTSGVATNIASSILTPSVESYLKETNESDRQKINHIKNIANSIDVLDTDNLRFITRNNVILREGPSTKTALVSEFSLGDIVVVLSKEQSWMEVMYHSDDGQPLHGWVFTRYTAKFKR